MGAARVIAAGVEARGIGRREDNAVSALPAPSAAVERDHLRHARVAAMSSLLMGRLI